MDIKEIKPEKIFEIRGAKWLSGLSLALSLPYGGLFRQASYFNPFQRIGFLEPTPAITELGSGTINTSKVIRHIIPFWKPAGSLPYAYVYADDNKLYETDFNNVTDVSAQINTATTTARGFGLWKSGVVYVQDTQARFNAIPVASGSDVQVLTGLTSAEHPTVVGSDKNFYIGDDDSVAKLTSSTGTSGNSIDVFLLESGFKIRKLINDGRYLVILADNAVIKTNYAQKNRCQVLYWDMVKGTADYIYEFADGFIAGGEMIGDIIEFLTPSGKYITSAGTKPKLILPFIENTSSAVIASSNVPTSFSLITTHRNILHWGVGNAPGEDPVYAHGSLAEGLPKITFNPYAVTGLSANKYLTAIGSNNSEFLMATGTGSSDVKLYSATLSSSNSSCVINICNIDFPQTFKFEFAKVILKTRISSGNSVALQILSEGDAKTIKSSETKTNTTDSGRKELTFRPQGATAQFFDELSTIKLTTNVAVQALEIYGTPTTQQGQYV